MRARHSYNETTRAERCAKRTAAGVLAAVVLLAQAMSAYASVTYDTADGTVYVKQEGTGSVSWQEESRKSSDPEIYIRGDKTAQEATTDQIVQVGDGVQEVSIYIEKVSTTGTTDAAVEIGKNADVELYITDTKIEDAKGDGIAIGENSEVDITFTGANTYSAAQDEKNENDTAGIRVAAPTAPTETATPQTEETQQEEVQTETPTQQEEVQTETPTGESQIQTQADETDTAAQTGTEAQEQEAQVTITGVPNAAGIASFTVTNADTGLYVGQNGSVAIDGEASSSENESAALELTLANNGVGVENHGVLTVTGGAEVTIASEITALDTTGKNAATVLENKASVSVDKGETVTENSATLTVEDATLTAQKVSLKNGAEMEIAGDAKVEANQIVDSPAVGVSASSNRLVITGGTLKLTGSKSGKSLVYTMHSGLNADHMETLYADVQNISNEWVIWPTNGATHGSDKLVNFQLTVEQLESMEGDFDVIDWMGGTYQYSVDLDKYEPDETLSVWVPAVLLDYYYRDDLPEGTRFEDMTEDEVRELLQSAPYRGGLQDAVIRGQSIQFATLKGYTTGNAEDESKTWYYYSNAPTADLEDGTVDDDVTNQTAQWCVFDTNTTVTARDVQQIYAFSSEHYRETTYTKNSETWERDDESDDDLDNGVSQTLGTLGTLGGLGGLGTGVFSNHGSTSATASLGEIDAQPNQPEQPDPENPEGDKTAETPAPGEEAGGKGVIHDTDAYAAAGAKTGDETPLWAACALLAACGLAATALNGKKRRIPCKH